MRKNLKLANISFTRIIFGYFDTYTHKYWTFIPTRNALAFYYTHVPGFHRIVPVTSHFPYRRLHLCNIRTFPQNLLSTRRFLSLLSSNYINILAILKFISSFISSELQTWILNYIISISIWMSYEYPEQTQN